MTSSTRISPVILLAMGLGLSVSCAETQQETMTPASGVAARFTSRRAIESISDGRCQRAAQCGKVGKDKSDFQSYDDCRGKVRVSLQQKFADDGCENGVGERDLTACLAEIKNEDCGGVAGVVDSIDRYLACRPGKLCLN